MFNSGADREKHTIVHDLLQCKQNVVCLELQSKKQLEQKRRVNVYHSISYGQFQPEVCEMLLWNVQ